MTGFAGFALGFVVGVAWMVLVLVADTIWRAFRRRRRGL